MSASTFRMAALAALVLASTPRAASTCYGIDGSRSDDSQQPCNPDAQYSPCCATNKARPDICMSSGLCYAQDAGYEGFIYSNGCTDPTGRAEACPHFCPDRTNDWKGGPAIGSYNVLQCNEGGKYCCRKALEPENFCGNKSAIMTINVGQLRAPARSKTGKGGGTTSVTSTSCDLARSSGLLARQCPRDNSAIVGGAVGGVLGVALLASLGALGVICTRRPNEGDTRGGPMEYPNIAVSNGQPQELSARPVHEVQGEQTQSHRT